VSWAFKVSLQRLGQLHPNLVKVLTEARMVASFEITSGLRSVEEQRRLVAKGYSKTMKSKHLTGEAADFAPYDPNVGLLMDSGDCIARLVNKYQLRTLSVQQIYGMIYAHYAYVAGVIRATSERLGIKVRLGIDWDNDGILLFDQNFQDWGHVELI
jgi:hypothetical protein